MAAGGGVRRRALLAAAVGGAALVAACGSAHGPRVPWQAALPWRELAPGREGGRAAGPLGAAVAGDRLAVLDSFGGVVLLWAWNGAWAGPLRVPVAAAGGPLAALALAPPGSGAVAAVADGAGTVWTVGAHGPARPALALPSAPGRARSVVGVAWPPGGPLVADVVEITDRRSERLLLAPGPRVLARAEVAAPAGETAPAALLLPPAGVRSALAAGGPGAVWLVGSRDGRPEVVRVGLDGRAAPRGAVPPLPRPVDFLGVDGAGLAYALAGAGGPAARVVAFRPGGAVEGWLAAPPGPGPHLPHPAAVDGRGALLLLTSGPEALELRYVPPGRPWRPESP